MKKAVLLFFFLIIYLYSYTQNYRLIKYDGDNILPSTLVKDIDVDKFGFVWIATDQGVIYFDGIKYKKYTNELPSNYVKQIFTSRNNELYIVTDLGIVKVDFKQDSVIFNTILKGQTTETDTSLFYPKTMFEDSRGTIWISDKKNIWKFTNNELKKYVFDKKNETTSYSRSYTFLENDSEDIFAFSQQGYSYYYDNKKDKFIELENKNIFPDVNHVINLNKDKYAVGTTEGIYFIEIRKNKIKILDVQKQNLNISYFYRENQFNVLIASWNNGLYRLQINSNNSIQQLDNLFSGNINSLAYHHRQGIWIASDLGLFLLKQTLFLSDFEVLNNKYINDIKEKDDTILVTDGNWIYKIYNNKVFPIFTDQQGAIEQIIPLKNADFAFCNSAEELVIVKKNKVYKRLDISNEGGIAFYGFEDHNENIWLCQTGNDGILQIDKQLNFRSYNLGDHKNQAVYALFNKKQELYCVAQGQNTYLFKYNQNKDKFINISFELPEEYNKLIVNQFVFDKQDNIYLATNFGLFYYDFKEIKQIDLQNYTDEGIGSIAIDNNENLWLAFSDVIIKYENKKIIKYTKQDGLNSSIAHNRNVFFDSRNNLWIGTIAGLSLASKESTHFKTFRPIISEIYLNGKPYQKEKIITNSYIEFNYFSPAFPEDEVDYQWRIDKESEWTNANAENKAFIPQLKKGVHKFQVTAKQHGNYLWSDITEFEFKVFTPWYQKWWAIGLFVLIFVGIIVLIVRVSTVLLRRRNQILEQKVKERTAVISKQNNELKEKRIELEARNTEIVEKNEQLIKRQDEILARNEEISRQKEILQQQNQFITSSIKYAKTIQKAMLPQNQEIASVFDYFLLYQAKNIVSGDFYWFLKQEIDNKIYYFVAVVDCTGHGVPGGFLSMIGTMILNKIIIEHKVYQPNAILEQLNNEIQIALHQRSSDNNDGMDICLCRILNHKNNYDIVFSGAKRSLYVNKQDANELLVYKGDRKGIGGINNKYLTKEIFFTNTKIQLSKNDLIYLTTDGFIDQNSPDRKKFSSKKLKNLLFEIKSLSTEKQLEKLELELKKHKQNEPLRDDITILGIKF